MKTLAGMLVLLTIAVGLLTHLFCKLTADVAGLRQRIGNLENGEKEYGGQSGNSSVSE